MAGNTQTSGHPGEPDAPSAAKKVSYASLPHKGQLAILCLARMADPLAQTSIQSYMFYQLKFFDPSLSDAAISAQAGFLVGAKTAAQVCTGMFWGRLADSESGGRKAVLLIGLFSCCVSYLGYGLARSFVAAVVWQVLGGSLSSNVALTRCVVAELNPEKRYRARALLLLPLFANAGNLLGPLVGGFLSSNAREGSSEQYPYLRPNLCVSGVYLVAALGVVFGLNETLESIQHSHEPWFRRILRPIKQFFSQESIHDRHTYTAIRGNDTAATPLTPSSESAPTSPKPAKRKRKLPFRRIWTFNVVCTLLSHFIIAGHLGTFSNLWAIFLSTPVGDTQARHPPFVFNGGLGMLPRDVGVAMALLGATGVLLQLVIYPLLQDRFGTVRIWRTALLVFPIVYLIAPFPSLVASAPSQRGGDSVTAPVWLATAAVILLFIVGRTGVTPATTLLINDCTPHPSVRGTIHTAGTVIGNLGRSLFPIGALAIFGQGLRIGVVGLGFWCLMGLAVLAYVTSLWVTEGSNGMEIVLDDDSDED